MKWRGSPKPFHLFTFERDNSVYFWSMGSYLLYNATTAVENQQETTSFTLKRGDPQSTILFILTTGTVITPQRES